MAAAHGGLCIRGESTVSAICSASAFCIKKTAKFDDGQKNRADDLNLMFCSFEAILIFPRFFGNRKRLIERWLHIFGPYCFGNEPWRMLDE